MNNASSACKSEIARNWGADLKAKITSALRAHAIFIVLVVSYAGIMLLIAALYGATDKVCILLYFNTAIWEMIIFWFLFAGVRALHIMLSVRPAHPFRYLRDDFVTFYLASERLIQGLLVFLLVPVFMSTLTSFKILIPVINPFCWDTTFAKWDAALHGGTQPWQLLHPILGYPLVTAVVSFFYGMWFLVMLAVMFWQMFSLRAPQLRMQFWLTYALSWILMGTVAAIAFASAGPCFYGRVVDGPDIFAPLMEYLHSANEVYPVLAVDAQEILWQWHEESRVGQVKGISAMPSLHVSMAFLFALLGWRTNWLLGVLTSAFALIIMLGCVHLGWHYAIDGYAAIVGTWLIWRGVGWLQARSVKRSLGTAIR